LKEATNAILLEADEILVKPKPLIAVVEAGATVLRAPAG
jgi:hypothetical protein